jgi:hypothetical protein
LQQLKMNMQAQCKGLHHNLFSKNRTNGADYETSRKGLGLKKGIIWK